MSRLLPVLALLAMAAAPSTVLAQYGYGTMHESVEPPLADDPNAAEIIRLASAQHARPNLAPVRTVDVPAPAVVLRMQAPSALLASQNVEIRMTNQCPK